MTTVHIWKPDSDLRPWASCGEAGREHLLAQFLHGNILDRASCDAVVETADMAAKDSAFESDLGFLNSVALYFAGGMATLDHVVPEYGTFAIGASELGRVVRAWKGVLESTPPVSLELNIENHS